MKNKVKIPIFLKQIVTCLAMAGFVSLLITTIVAGQEEGVFDAFFRLWPQDWFKATIIDFYNNQLLIWLWICLRHDSFILKGVLLILCLSFGSFTSIIYFLFVLWKSETYHQLFFNQIPGGNDD